MRRLVQSLARSVSVYAASSVYGVGVLAMLLIASGEIVLIFGIFAFGIVTIIIALIALFRETRQVHILVNSQHDALDERVDQLVATLHSAGVRVPQAYSKEGSRNG